MGIFIFIVVNLVQYLSMFVDLAVQYQAPLWSVLKIVFYLIPFLMTFTIPIGVLIGVILALGHFNQNNELIALQANGLSRVYIFKPAIFCGIVFFVFQILFFQWILPWGNTKFLEEKFKMLKKNPISQIQKKQIFSDGLRELKISNINNDTLYGVSFIDSTTNTLYYAQTGFIKPSIEEKTFNIPITLHNATALPFIFDKVDNDFSLQFFDKITVYIKAFNAQTIVPEGSELIGLTELYHLIKEKKIQQTRNTLVVYHQLLSHNNEMAELQAQLLTNKSNLSNNDIKILEEKIKNLETLIQSKTNTFASLNSKTAILDDTFLFQKKLAFAVDSIIMALLGIPLAFFKKRQGKEIAIGLSVVCVIVFNSLLAISNFLFKSYAMGAYTAAWFPTITIVIITIVIMVIRIKKA